MNKIISILLMALLLSFIVSSPIGITRAIIDENPIVAPTPISSPVPQQIPSASMINQIPYQRPVLSQYINQQPPMIHRHYGNYYQPIRQSIVNPYIRPVTTVPIQVPSYQPLIYTVAPVQIPSIVNTVTVAPPTLISTEEIDSNDICQIRGKYNQLCLMKFSNVDDHPKYNSMFKCLPKAICTYREGKCQWLQTKQFKHCLNRINLLKMTLTRLEE